MKRNGKVKNLLRELKADAVNIDEKALQFFCMVFTIVGIFMFVLNTVL